MYRKLVPAFATCLLSACYQPAPSPDSVTETYWTLIQTGKLAEAERLVSDDSRAAFRSQFTKLEPVTHFSLGKSTTTVETILNPSTAVDARNQPFHTVLKLENGQWKIDANQTRIPPKPVSHEEQLERLTQDLSQTMRNNLDTLDETMREGVKLLNEALRDSSREMGDSLLNGMKELNESMKRSLEQLKQRRQQPPRMPPPNDDGEGRI